jgi:hypothetical protein
MLYKNMQAYSIIKEYYGDRAAERSKVPLINHIDEGLIILRHIKADGYAMEAYCLHPMFQSDAEFMKNIKTVDKFQLVDRQSLMLCMEYRRVANSYLSTSLLSSFVGFTDLRVRDMLIADKVQNYKDFINHHFLIHERSQELHSYFISWQALLDIDFNNFISTTPEGKLYLNLR